MTKGAIAAIVTGVSVAVIHTASAVVFFAGLLIGLNGFMGQERAVNGAFITFIGLALVAFGVGTAGGCRLAYFLTERKKWHPAGSAALAIILACVIGVGAHVVAVAASAIVADQMRTTR